MKTDTFDPPQKLSETIMATIAFSIAGVFLLAAKVALKLARKA